MERPERSELHCPNPKCKERFQSREIPSSSDSAELCPFCGSNAVAIEPHWVDAWVADNLPLEIQSIQIKLRSIRRIGVVVHYLGGFLFLIACVIFSWPIGWFVAGVVLWFISFHTAFSFVSKSVSRGYLNSKLLKTHG